MQKLDAKKGEIVLEIGFGTGYSISALAQSVGSSGRVYGIDISDGMFKITWDKVKKAELKESVRLILGDGAKLPFKANFFDAIFMTFTLELFDTPEISTVLCECKRVLRKGGRILVVAMSKKEKDGRESVIMGLYEWVHKNFQNYVDCRPIFVNKALEDADFQIINVTVMSMWGLPVEIVMAERI